MRSQVNDHDKHTILIDFVYDSVLISQPRGAMTLPIATKGLIVESTYQAQPCWSRQLDNVFPFLVTFEYLFRRSPNTTQDVPMLEYLPHTIYDI
jgi:hypothetical protein